MTWCKTFGLCSTKQQTHRSFKTKFLNPLKNVNIWLCYVVIIHLCSVTPAEIFQSLVTKPGYWQKTKPPKFQISFVTEMMGAAVDVNTTAIFQDKPWDSHSFPCVIHHAPVSEALYITIKRHQMTAPSCFYNQGLQDNILRLVCIADASLCSDHLIHKAVSRKKDRYECLYCPSHRLSHCYLSLHDIVSCSFASSVWSLSTFVYFFTGVLEPSGNSGIVLWKTWMCASVPLTLMLIKISLEYRTDFLNFLQKKCENPCFSAQIPKSMRIIPTNLLENDHNLVLVFQSLVSLATSTSSFWGILEHLHSISSVCWGLPVCGHAPTFRVEF